MTSWLIDLYAGNILLNNLRFGNVGTKELYVRIGEPQHIPVQRTDGQTVGRNAPKCCVPRPWVGTPKKQTKSDVQLVVIDFKEASLAVGEPKPFGTPVV